MAEDINFKALTEAIRGAGNAILQETATLKEQTNTQIGNIDNTCKSLPPAIYQFLEPSFLAWKAYLGRSNDERDRIGKLLQLTSTAIEQKEQSIKTQYNQQHK